MTGGESSPARLNPPLGPPLAVRLISLLMIGWLITLAISVAIVVLLPPPSPGVYRLSEISAALHGGALKTRDGHPLVRLRQDDPPAQGETRMTSGIFRLALASSMGLPPTRVRFERYPIADPIQRAVLRGLVAAPPQATFLVAVPTAYTDPFAENLRRIDRGDGVGAPIHAGLHANPPKLAGERPSLDAFPPVIGEFSAAVQDGSGDWIVVKPKPLIFPSVWQQRIILWFLLCFGVLAPVGYLSARRLTASLGRFALAAEHLGRDPSGPAMELSGPAEIGRAAAAFNEMQDRLRRYVEHRTQMVGAMAHDLRTPLTRIRFKIERLPGDAKDPIIRDIVQMEQMISAALAFVRGAAERRPRELMDLSSVLECVVDSATLTDADVKLIGGAGVVVHADGLALERLFANLIDNAVKYGRRARVKLHREGANAVVEVSDSGRGIPEADLERVFEPFFRVEPSRNPQTGGMGLGLSVARSIARAHGGDIELINGKGLTARVWLPLALPGEVVDTASGEAELV